LTLCVPLSMPMKSDIGLRAESGAGHGAWPCT
jgi:hypothetical protein